MDWTIEQQSAPALTRVRVRGRFTAEGARAGLLDLAGVKDPLCPLLIDDREVDFRGVDDTVLMVVNAAFAARASVFGYCRTAVLVGGVEARDLADRWRRLADSEGRGNIAVFTEEWAAVIWATEQD